MTIEETMEWYNERFAEARKKYQEVIGQAIMNGEGSIGEADADVNFATDELIHAYWWQYGTIWLGRINIYAHHEEVMWEQDTPRDIPNFGADFVVPAYDQVLYDLIMERKNATYTGVNGDIPRVDAIHKRIYELGGETLVWS